MATYTISSHSTTYRTWFPNERLTSAQATKSSLLTHIKAILTNTDLHICVLALCTGIIIGYRVVERLAY